MTTYCSSNMAPHCMSHMTPDRPLPIGISHVLVTFLCVFIVTPYCSSNMAPHCMSHITTLPHWQLAPPGTISTPFSQGYKYGCIYSLATSVRTIFTQMDAATTITLCLERCHRLFKGGYHLLCTYVVLSTCEEYGKLRQVDEAFCFASIVRRQHVYKTVWTPFLGEILIATPEPKNNMHADIFCLSACRQAKNVSGDKQRMYW